MTPRPGRTLVVMAAVFGLIAVVVAFAWSSGFRISGGILSRDSARANPPNVALVPPPNLIRLVPPETALKLNAIRPFSTRADQPAASFWTGKVKDADLSRAIDCLAQAIYYEAGGEGQDGERAVAQVILNRVRHPGFPPSICGAVYQGAERATGCQFTFTCDGSLLRTPLGPLWTRARRLARDALVSGYVYGPVGHATHYHADYVIPYWADSLEKEIKIGQHIFYRLPGFLGTATAFGQRYARVEPAPPSPSAAKVAAEAIQGVVDDQAAQEDPLGAIVGSRPGDSTLPPALPLTADENAGSLITPYASHLTSAVPNMLGCAPAVGPKQIKPAAANDLRTRSRATIC